MRFLKNKNLVFLDLETTGLNTFYGDRICEIALLICQGFEIKYEFETLVNPERPISPGAFAVNRITSEMLKGAPRFIDITDEILRLLRGKIVICHNADFDLGFLEYELARLDIELFNLEVIDTLKLARRYFRFGSNNLTGIAQALGISLEIAHRALSDVYTTREIFINFIPELSAKGINSLEEIIISWQSSRRFLSYKKSFPALPPAIEELIKDKRPVKIHYISKEGIPTERIVEPREITNFSDYLYLVGYCHLRKEERSFRLDRIVRMQRL